jgi:hypothetical protein
MTELGHESLLAPIESNPSDRVEVHGGSASHPLAMLLQPRAPLGPRPIPPHVQVRRGWARRLTVGRWQTLRGQAVDTDGDGDDGGDVDGVDGDGSGCRVLASDDTNVPDRGRDPDELEGS